MKNTNVPYCPPCYLYSLVTLLYSRKRKLFFNWYSLTESFFLLIFFLIKLNFIIFWSLPPFLFCVVLGIIVTENAPFYLWKYFILTTCRIYANSRSNTLILSHYNRHRIIVSKNTRQANCRYKRPETAAPMRPLICIYNHSPSAWKTTRTTREFILPLCQRKKKDKIKHPIVDPIATAFRWLAKIKTNRPTLRHPSRSWQRQNIWQTFILIHSSISLYWLTNIFPSRNIFSHLTSRVLLERYQRRTVCIYMYVWKFTMPLFGLWKLDMFGHPTM